MLIMAAAEWRYGCNTAALQHTHTVSRMCIQSEYEPHATMADDDRQRY